MTSANIPAPVHGQDADAPDLAHGTGKDTSVAACLSGWALISVKDPRGGSIQM